MAGSENGAGPKFVIEMAPATGALSINYPSDNKGNPNEILCLYMLERAKMLIEDKIREAAAPRIVRGGVMPPMPRGIN